MEAGDWRGDGFGPKIDERYLGLEVQCGYRVPRDVRAGDHVADRYLHANGYGGIAQAGTPDAESPLRQTCTCQANFRTPDQIRLPLGNRQQEVLFSDLRKPCRPSITSCERKMGAPSRKVR